ncbi:SPOR domain-containing protein [Endozoicomonas lisbonensis]|uniref:Septal ring-binding cell division protein DamX n=1 Tax=Endozoicomonas lisbonensis TaxID=3120522 RepID=A0ABV2SH59_9GAMM
MPGRVLFTCKPLSLSVVAALAPLSAPVAEALLLPPKPLALSSSWDCKSNANNDWLCRRDATSDYSQPLEEVARQRKYQPAQAREDYLSANGEPSANRESSTNRGYLPAPEGGQYPPQQEYNPAYPSSSNNSFRNTPYQALYQPAPDYPQPPPARQYRESPVTRLPSEQFLPISHKQPVTFAEAESQNLNRLLNAPHGSYVLQWLAAHTPKPLRELQNYYPVLQEAAIVQYRRNGKEWYVLLDGPFNDRNSATEALQAAPRSGMINKLYPWTRSVASIQKLDLVRPDITNPIPEQPVLADQYNMPVGSPQPAETMFASIAPAYPSMEQASDYSYEYPDYNTVTQPESHDYNTNPFQQPIQYNQQKPEHLRGYKRNTERQSSQQYQQEKESEKVLEAPPGSYTIQWLASSKRETLERTKQRFPYLEDAQVIQYRKRGRNWYVLASPAYGSLAMAKRALEQPAYARIATRLYPRVRPVDSLRQLVALSKPARQDQRITASQHRSRLSRQPSASPAQPVRNHPGSLLQNSDGSYTIQWFAANKPESIKKMKQRFPELASAITVHYRRNQKDWYVLLQGQFSSSSEALSIIKSPVMQDAVRVLHPWTRPLTSLKKLGIRET